MRCVFCNTAIRFVGSKPIDSKQRTTTPRARDDEKNSQLFRWYAILSLRCWQFCYDDELNMPITERQICCRSYAAQTDDWKALTRGRTDHFNNISNVVTARLEKLSDHCYLFTVSNSGLFRPLFSHGRSSQ